MRFLYQGPDDAAATLLLAHGAGSGMDSPWLVDFSRRLAERGLRTARFEFDYMASRRNGSRRGQPRAEAVMDEYRSAIATVDRSGGALVIGGKSFGGRVASMIADEAWTARDVAALVCLGYPFHPPGSTQKLRTAHLLELQCPALICQGARDPFGREDEVTGYRLSPSIRLHWLEDGDHDLRPRKGVTGLTHADNLDSAADAVADFAESLPGRP